MANTLVRAKYTDPTTGKEMFDWQTPDGQTISTLFQGDTVPLYNTLSREAPAAPAAITAPAATTFASEPAEGSPEVLDGGTPDDVTAAPQPTMDAPPSVGALMGTIEDESTATQTRGRDKGLQDAYNTSVQEHLKATDAVNKHAIATAERESERAKQEALLIKQQNEQEEARVKEEQAAIDTQNKELRDMQAANDGMKLDNNRFWSRLDTGNRILAGVALAMGALGQALTQGKSNMALDVINKAIDRDIDEQKHNMAKSDRDLTQRRGIFQDFRQKVGDDRLARSLSRERAWKAVEADFNEKAAGARVPEVKDRALQMAAEAKARADKEVMDQTEYVTTKTKSKKTAPLKTNAAKPIYERIEEGPRKELDAARDQLRYAEKLKKLTESKEWQEGAGVITGNWLKAVQKVGIQQTMKQMETTTIRNEIDRIKYSILKAMSGSGVTESEMSRYDPLFPDLGKDPKTAAAAVNGYLKTRAEEYTEARNRIGKGYRVAGDPEFESMYPAYGGSTSDNKSKLGFTK